MGAGKQPIVVIAGDPGGAVALIPVITKVLQDRIAPLGLLGYREAAEIWQEAAFPVETIPDDATDSWLGDRLAGARLLLVATSVNGIDFERRATRVASRLGIRSLALLDFWSNYRLRFEDADGRLLLPDRIAVMDELAVTEMIAAGFPADILVVTGQPAFDGLHEHKCSFTPTRRAQVRHNLGIEDSELLVLYASQPFSALYGSLEKARAALGFDEEQVFELCFDTLAQLAGRHGKNLVFGIRRHRREAARPYQPSRIAGFRAISCQRHDRHEAILAADLVLGMNSALLMEAALLGQIVVSVQPGLRGADALPCNRDGRSVLVTDRQLVKTKLETALFDHAWRRRQAAKLQDTRLQPDAAGNVVRLAADLIARCPLHRQLHRKLQKGFPA